MKKYQTQTYPADTSACFMRSRERYGDLSNMTFGFGLEVNGIRFQSSEGLYQALKFPSDAPHQKRIAAERSGMEAKKTAYRNPQVRPDWEDIKTDAMALTVAIKLLQHPERFGSALRETGGKTVVEKSYRDQFWGAKPSQDGKTLMGRNVLGELLTELRECLQGNGDVLKAVQEYLSGVNLDQLSINGRRVINMRKGG